MLAAGFPRLLQLERGSDGPGMAEETHAQIQRWKLMHKAMGCAEAIPGRGWQLERLLWKAAWVNS